MFRKCYKKQKNYVWKRSENNLKISDFAFNFSSAAKRVGVAVVELHTGAYCDYFYETKHAQCEAEFENPLEGARSDCGRTGYVLVPSPRRV